MDSPALRESLRQLASNHRWTWSTSCHALLDSLPGSRPGRHPVEVVEALGPKQLGGLLSDDHFVEMVSSEVRELERALADPGEIRIAYCSPEFGLTGAIPQYAGGLGILAGDHLKTASDLHLPVAGVGLFYRYGVFRQHIDGDSQTEGYQLQDPSSWGAVDTGEVVEIPFPGRNVFARLWRLDVGRVPLILLDTYLDANSEHDRNITDRLYIGFTDHRVEQEMVLGVGGGRALARLGWPISIHHLNEGHAGFITLELIDRVIEDGDLAGAIDKIRSGLVFTTHTPVPAGIDRFDKGLIAPYLQIWAKRWRTDIEEIFALGQDPDDASKFNMAALCLRSTGAANGVSELHGEVSRRLFAGVGLGDHMGHVTNGVHARTWTAPHMQTLFDDVLGPTWSEGDTDSWNRVGHIELERLEDGRLVSSRFLADLVRDETGHSMDPEALIVGFARRFAPYKRATLFMRDRERLAALLANDERPVHFVFAGKAHPSDQLGKSLVSEVIAFSRSTDANHRLTFIPDYNMRIAHAMVQGCDVWLNNPIRPREASGTSGEKAVLNGGLNCSILDGWWAEMFDGQNGWMIEASEAEVPEARDDEEAAGVLETLESVVEEYHGARYVFNGRIRHAWQSLGPRVTSARMLRDYQDRYYSPTLAGDH